MPCAHAEPERSRLARNPAAYGFSGINATALDCGKDVERPEDPTTNKKLRLVTQRREELYSNPGAHRAMQMNVVWSATCMPGHMRRPNPKGILKSLSTLPFQFPAGLCGVKNREGLNVSGSSNTFGSMTRTLWIGASGVTKLVQISK
jgi:hypothetical protein